MDRKVPAFRKETHTKNPHETKHEQRKKEIVQSVDLSNKLWKKNPAGIVTSKHCKLPLCSSSELSLVSVQKYRF